MAGSSEQYKNTITFAKKIVGILRYVSAEHDMPYCNDEILFEILHYDFFNIPPIEIAKIVVEANKKRKTERCSIRKLLQEKINIPQIALFEININQELGNAGKMLETLVRDLPNVPVHTLFEKMIHDTDLVAYITKSTQKSWLFQVCNTLSNFITAQSKDNPAIGLKQLLKTIDTVIESKTLIPVVEIKGTEKEVNLLPVQESMELKYEHVFFVGSNALLWEDKSKPITEEKSSIEFEKHPFTARASAMEKAEADFVSKLLDKFVMNVTALNNFLRCPLEFYFKNLLHVPFGKSEASEFGSAVHYTIQRLFEKMQTDPAQQFPLKTEMIEDFKGYIHHHRENFTAEAFGRRLEYGAEILHNYYDNYIHSWNKVVAIERNIQNVTVKGIPIKGKLDKLEFYGKDVNVVDYKSGDYEKAREKLASPNDKNPHGGDYWRQAVFYKLLIDNYPGKSWKVVSTEFDFVEPDKKNEYHKERIVILPPDIETVTQQIMDAWQKIQNHEFYTGCGRENCRWCKLWGMRYQV